MDFIRDVGAGLLQFLQGLPAPLYTLAGVALGIAGTMWVERSRHNRQQAEKDKDRLRDACVTALEAATEYMAGTHGERVLMRLNASSSADITARNNAVITFDQKARTVATASTTVSLLASGELRRLALRLRKAVMLDARDAIRVSTGQEPITDEKEIPEFKPSLDEFHNYVMNTLSLTTSPSK